MQGFFDLLKDALEKDSIGVQASECHGLLTGLVCAQSTFDTNKCLATFFRELGQNEATIKKHASLMQRIVKQIYSDLDVFEFNIMLPSDKASVIARTEALADWCRGFLLGFGLGNPSESLLESQGVKELLKDFSQFTMVQVDEESEQAEKDFFASVEYIRTGVMNIFASERSGDVPSQQDVIH